MNPKRSSQRKRALVDRSVQGSLVKRILFHWLVFFALTATTFVFMRALLDNPELSLLQRMENRVGDFLLLAVLVLCLLPSFMLDTIRFSNRFVGPIYRMRGVIKRLARNEAVEPIAFRKGDFWHDAASEFNQLIELVNRQHAKIQELESAAAQRSQRSTSGMIQIH